MGSPGDFRPPRGPVQISYVGYWSTTGLTEMDWFFPDPGCDAGYDAHFTEGSMAVASRDGLIHRRSIAAGEWLEAGSGWHYMVGFF